MVAVTVWNENQHERATGPANAMYPDGIHTALAEMLVSHGHTVQTATLDEPEHGLTADVLAETDVLLWWGDVAHDAVTDTVAARVEQAVRGGMGFIPLHSSYESKPFESLMGTSGVLRWREEGERERVWVVEADHPITDGLPEEFELERAEIYGQGFDLPQPDTLVTVSWCDDGTVFPSGCCYHPGDGRVFYFQPGHETFPVYHHPAVQQLLHNAVEWAAPTCRTERSRGAQL
ncbi:trehalose utilization protein ThuA [Haloarcula mannanilytica]|uniref:Trehalose utilization protein ThuA n=1 Tax=Haloarcula mannanilytica TaxID=2509225 RepID=A0A4C2EQ49_9EURY|nr:ThuA domain-containing protein [Haloarcula mannanilytica]GCF14723.1 trehalose utilization protein ThuA [Haloarcula mannanilytica]